MSRGFELPPGVPLAEQRGDMFAVLVAVMRRLLADDGCPWDREQSPESLRDYVLEEACEVIDAIDGGDREELCEELGDLAFQVVFLAELARREGAFGPDDALLGICQKLVRRHPHVFEEAAIDGSDPDARARISRRWEEIKREEKGWRPLLAGVPRSLPALRRANSISTKVAQVGFDWPDAAGSRAKVNEELAELDEALAREDLDEAEAELGDVLFALVNLARHRGVDPERALRRTCDKFQGRFAFVED
ncbi:MAG: nucleoside triphosphate pyrophosphohydrolase, partial [Myxococcales bacterium]|nr:nucleoside triphosphate pyrophosphohydrolase [Myxococcales bacterium]